MHRLLPAVCLLVLVGGCSKSPTNPSSDSASVLQGQTVSAVDGAASPSTTVQIGARLPVTADGNGHFNVEVGGPGAYDARIRGNGLVDRETTLVSPSEGRSRVSLIPTTFDLTAFDEMFRTSNARLQRWTTRPSLVVLASVMEFKTASATDFTASSEQMSEAEVSAMVDHLTEGLALLTGNAFTTFESVDVERPAAGTRVNVTRNGRIVVGRYNGIVTFASTIGYGQWSELSNGTVVAGSMFLDRDFDRNDERRRLLRIHELGHALGYLHVRTRTSVMNPSIGPEPTDFDRSAAIIAFQRLPGNRAPDVDPSFATRSFSVAAGGGEWKPPVFCR